MNGETVTTIVDDDGNEQALSRNELLTLLKVKDFVLSNEAFERIVRFRGWLYVALTLLDVFSTPSNIDELWVWRRFAWVFGEGGTWDANRSLNQLLAVSRTVSKLSYSLDSLPWWRWLARRKLSKRLVRGRAQLDNFLAVSNRLSSNWCDLEAFAAFGGPYALEATLPPSNIR